MAYETIDLSVTPADGWVLVATDPNYLYVRPNANVPWFLAVTASGAPNSAWGAATGTVTFSDVPTADDEVVIGGDTYVFKASAADPFEITIGADAAGTATNMIAIVNSDGTAGVTASDGGSGIVTLTADTEGVSGNAIVLTTNADNTTVSGSGTLTGGVDPLVGVMMQGPSSQDPKQHYEHTGATSAEFYVRVADYQQAQTQTGVPFGVIRDEA